MRSMKQLKKQYPRKFLESRADWKERLLEKQRTDMGAQILYRVFVFNFFKFTPPGVIGYFFF